MVAARARGGRTRGARGLGTVVVCLVLAWAALVPGAPTLSRAAPVAGVDDAKEAKRLFQRAELSFNLGKFEEALADYQSAYQAKPLPAFLFNIAQCYRNLGNWDRARFFYRRYLTLDPRSPNRHRVDDLVAEMTQKLDQAPPVPPPSPPPPPPAVEPPPAPAPPLAAVPLVEPSAEPAVSLVATPAPASRPVAKRWWFWAGVGVLVAGAVVGGVLLTRPKTETPGSLDPIDGR